MPHFLERHPLGAKLCLLVLSTALSCALGWSAYRRYRIATLGGTALNSAAWEASFRERDEPVPATGPRDGYWGDRLSRRVPDKDLHHHERELHIPGLVDIDVLGLQHANSLDPRWHVLLIGGSVAFGAYAAYIETTYFVQMLTLLEARGYPVELTVDAAGAWTSFNETAAYRLDVAPLHPDVVVFLDGLNDLTQNKPDITRNPVKSYVENMREALELSHRNGVRMVVVLQPLLADKRFTTPLERRILQFPVNAVDRVPGKGAAWPQRYVEAFQTYRQHLQRMAARRGMSFVDCSDALSDERATTFADFWHFADPGHRLLARCIAEGLIPVLDSLPRASLDR